MSNFKKAWNPPKTNYTIKKINEKTKYNGIHFKNYKKLNNDISWNEKLDIFLWNQAWFKIRLKSNDIKDSRKINLKNKFNEMIKWFSSFEEPKPNKFINEWEKRENYRKKYLKSFYVENIE